MAPSYQSQSLDHLGLVAGMFEELGIGDVIDRAIAQDMTKRTVSLGHAVKAMILNGLGFVNQQLYLVPSFFQHKPTERLVGPGITAEGSWPNGMKLSSKTLPYQDFAGLSAWSGSPQASVGQCVTAWGSIHSDRVAGRLPRA
jgi:Domain of unknown function (DUF4277)